MNIGGFQAQSTVDFPGCLAAVVFTVGCNLNCSYCHNRELIPCTNNTPLTDPEAVLGALKRRRRFLDGVVVSGGEPTLQPGLEAFLRRLRDMDYRIKLDTNGTRPLVIERLIDEGLVDFVAMDVKAPFSGYADICGGPVDIAALQASISLLMQERVDYEFRTTLAPELSRLDLDVIQWMLEGARSHVLQKCRLGEGQLETRTEGVASSSGRQSGLAAGRLSESLFAGGRSSGGRFSLRGMGVSAIPLAVGLQTSAA